MLKNYIQILVVFVSICTGQSQEIRLADIPFSEGDVMLDLAFAGGLRAPQFNTIDLNVDGLEDILIFDRDGEVFTPLIRNMDGGFSFDPEYRDILPKVESWILMRDFNNDGIKDIFCSPIQVGIPGVEVYKGVIEEGVLRFELVLFPERDFDILFFPIGNSVTQIFASVIDIPDIRDVDGDGDLDIVAFEPSGSTIYQYENQSVEQGFGSDTLIYVLSESCYGGVVESGFSQEVSLSPDPGVCASFLWEGDDLFAETRHSGSTVLSIDVSGDDLQELLLGDISYDGLVALTNSGTPEQAHFTDQVVRFPDGDNPADLELFLAGFYEDVDVDGLPELIVVPNDRFSAQTMDHIWVYDVVETSGQPSEFNLTTKNYLVDDMIFPGPFSAPLFFDYNSDGLTDLLIGTGGRNTDGVASNPALVLYENKGTPSSPSYDLVDEDYLSMAAFKTTSRNFVPTLGDIDGDGDLDMMIGDNTGRFYYLQNLSEDPNSFDFDTPIYEAFGLKVSSFAVPAILDVNNDGLGDLIVGEQNFNSFLGERGSINYFQNIGTVGNPQFEPDETVSPNNPLFGAINLKEAGFINNYSAPTVVDIGEDLLIASGAASGSITLYQTPKSAIEDTLTVRSMGYGGLIEGEQSVLSFADINNDDFLELAIGTRRGGLAIYHTDIKVDLDSPTNQTIVRDKIQIIPNPVADRLSFQLPNNNEQVRSTRIFSASGAVVFTDYSGDSSIDISTLVEGLYILEIRTEAVTYTGKLVKVD